MFLKSRRGRKICSHETTIFNSVFCRRAAGPAKGRQQGQPGRCKKVQARIGPGKAQDRLDLSLAWLFSPAVDRRRLHPSPSSLRVHVAGAAGTMVPYHGGRGQRAGDPAAAGIEPTKAESGGGRDKRAELKLSPGRTGANATSLPPPSVRDREHQTMPVRVLPSEWGRGSSLPHGVRRLL